MGFLDIFRRGQSKIDAPPVAPQGEKKSFAIGATKDDITITFNDKNITYTGDLAQYDYNAILRDKQRNIYQLFELSDYFVDADPIYRGIIKEVYSPFSMADHYR